MEVSPHPQTINSKEQYKVIVLDVITNPLKLTIVITLIAIIFYLIGISTFYYIVLFAPIIYILLYYNNKYQFEDYIAQNNIKL